MQSLEQHPSLNVMRTLSFFFSSRMRHTRSLCDWSSDVCSSDRGVRAAVVVEQVDDRHRLVHPYDRLKRDRKSVVWGKSVHLGGRRIIKKKKEQKYWFPLFPPIRSLNYPSHGTKNLFV